MNERECKLKECQGKPRCGTCLALDARYFLSGAVARAQASQPPQGAEPPTDWEAAYRQFADGPAFGPEVPALKKAFAAGMAWQASQSEGALRAIMRAADAAKESCGIDPESPAAIRNGKFATIAQIAAQGLGLVRGPALAAPPQGASSLLRELVACLEDAREDTVECLNQVLPHAGYARYDRRIEAYRASIARSDAALEAARRLLSASPLPAPQEPADWADQVEQRLLTWRQRFMNKSGDQLALDDFMGQESIDDLIDFVCAPLYAAPAPVGPESQGSSEPRLSDRDLIDRFDL